MREPLPFEVCRAFWSLPIGNRAGAKIRRGGRCCRAVLRVTWHLVHSTLSWLPRANTDSQGGDIAHRARTQSWALSPVPVRVLKPPAGQQGEAALRLTALPKNLLRPGTGAL